MKRCLMVTTGDEVLCLQTAVDDGFADSCGCGVKECLLIMCGVCQQL